MTYVVKCDGCDTQLDPEFPNPDFELKGDAQDAPIEIKMNFTHWEHAQHYCEDCAKKLILRLADSLRA